MQTSQTTNPPALTPDDPHAAFREALIAAGHLIPSGVPGLYGRSGVFEDVVERFDRYITSVGGNDGATVMRFPVIFARAQYERSDHLQSFPHLAGVVSSFHGNEREHRAMLAKLDSGEDWTTSFGRTDVVLTPAACYPIYPTLTGETVSAEGRLFDVLGTCFRHEPSPDPARMQMFRQREYVRVGDANAVKAHRDLWLERSLAMLKAVELPVKADIANDPFFGRAGQMLAANQRDQALKFEMLVPITSEEKPTACVSCNYHEDHFGHAFGIKLASGGPAHTACVGFGMERIALALFKWHGLDVDRWPSGVRKTLGF